MTAQQLTQPRWLDTLHGRRTLRSVATTCAPGQLYLVGPGVTDAGDFDIGNEATGHFWANSPSRKSPTSRSPRTPTGTMCTW